LDIETWVERYGREGIRAYWRRATADQEQLVLRFGEPVVSADGGRAAVEW
jgi:hypothetical protein